MDYAIIKLLIIKEERGMADNLSLFNYLFWLAYYIDHYVTHDRQKFRNEDERPVLKKGRFCRFGRSVEDYSRIRRVDVLALLSLVLCYIINFRNISASTRRGGTPRRSAGLPLVTRERRPSSTRYFISRRLGKKIIERAMSAECPRILSNAKSLGREAETRRANLVRAEKRAHASESITLAHEACQGYL